MVPPPSDEKTLDQVPANTAHLARLWTAADFASAANSPNVDFISSEVEAPVYSPCPAGNLHSSLVGSVNLSPEIEKEEVTYGSTPEQAKQFRQLAQDMYDSVEKR